MASVPIQVAGQLRRGRLAAGWQRLKQEPLIHFLLLGALIFVVAHLAEQAREDAQRQIVVDDQLKQRITTLQLAQNGRAPSPEQLQRLVENYIDDEVMYREALRMGLDQDDEIVRRRLIQKMQFLQRDLVSPAAPSEAALHAYFSEHVQRFSLPAKVEFEQVYFSPDLRGWADAENAARRARTQLVNGAAVADVGDAFPLQIDMRALTRTDVQQVFGSTPIVDTLFATRAGEWSQPVKSGYGWHVVRPIKHDDAQVPAFASVRRDVEAAYREAEATAAAQRQVTELRARYQVVRPDERTP
ncbi:MAG: peptidylprolyl isomerase [Steroidobacteraceae bacterium]